MSQKDNGGTAFPGPSFTQGGHPNGHSMGMTLRDWFAGQALAGFYANPDPHMPAELDGKPGVIRVAQAAYQIADAMLEARK